MKKSILALLAMAALGSNFAFADITEGDRATGFFRWSGQVLPVNTEGGGLVIMPAPGSAPHDNGVLTFDNDGEEIKLSGSDILSFQVFEEDEIVNGQPITDSLPTDKFDYKLQNLTVNAGIILGNESQNTEVSDAIFDVMANGQSLVDATDELDGEETVSLQIVQKDTTKSLGDYGIQANATVSVIAAVLVTDNIDI